MCVVVRPADLERATAQGDNDGAVYDPAQHRDHRGRAGAAAASESLARAPLPGTLQESAASFELDEFDVHAIRKSRVVLDHGSDFGYGVGLYIIDNDDGMGVPHRGRRQNDRFTLAAHLQRECDIEDRSVARAQGGRDLGWFEHRQAHVDPHAIVARPTRMHHTRQRFYADLIASRMAMVAQELVCRHPKRATRLVLACTSPGGPTTSSYPLHELTDLSERNRAIRISEILDTRYGAAWREANTDHAENLIKLVLTRTTPRSNAAERGQRLQLEARSHHDARERLRKITMPTYICAGKHDGIASPENQHALASLLPNGKLDFFDGGHLFLMQDPMAFESISEFLLTD